MADSSVRHCLPEFAQIHIHGVSDALQPSHPLLHASLFCLQIFPTLQPFRMNRLLAQVLELQLGQQTFQ